MRLEKYIASAGIASRRAVKRAIREGNASVNGTTILIPGHPIDVEKDWQFGLKGDRLNPLPNVSISC